MTEPKKWSGRTPIVSEDRVRRLAELQPHYLAAHRTLGEVVNLAETWQQPLPILRKYLRRPDYPVRRTRLTTEQVRDLKKIEPEIMQAKATIESVERLADDWQLPAHVLRKYLRGKGPKRFRVLHTW